MSSSTILRCSVDRGVRCAAALAAGWLMVAAPAGGAERVSAAADCVPEGLSASDWSGIRAAYEAKRHEAFAVEVGYVARNPGQQWRTRFDGRGFETTPDGGGWSWGLELVGYGRGDQSRDRPAAGSQPTCMKRPARALRTSGTRR